MSKKSDVEWVHCPGCGKWIHIQADSGGKIYVDGTRSEEMERAREISNQQRKLRKGSKCHTPPDLKTIG